MNTNIDRRTDYLNLVIMYLEYRKSFKFNYQPYFFWRNLISYITNNHDQRFLRYLFNRLVREGYIKNLRSKRKYTLTYIYNPCNKSIEPNLILNFD